MIACQLESQIAALSRSKCAEYQDKKKMTWSSFSSEKFTAPRLFSKRVSKKCRKPWRGLEILEIRLKTKSSEVIKQHDRIFRHRACDLILKRERDIEKLHDIHF